MNELPPTFEEWLSSQIEQADEILSHHSPGSSMHTYGRDVKGTLYRARMMYRQYEHVYRVTKEQDYECVDIGEWSKQKLRAELERDCPKDWELCESNPDQWIIKDRGGCPVRTYNFTRIETS